MKIKKNRRKNKRRNEEGLRTRWIEGRNVNRETKEKREKKDE